MNPALADTPICVEARLLTRSGTGASSYARNLIDTLAGAGHAPLLLRDRYVDRDAGEKTRLERWLRWGRACLGGDVQLTRDAAGDLFAPDIFRLTQVRFDRSGRIVTLQPPLARGIMHWAYPVPLRMAGWVNLYTVHDAIPLTHPDLTPIDGARHRRLLEALVPGAAAFVTVTEDARHAIDRTLDLPEGFVVDCGQAVSVPATVAPPVLPDGIIAGRYFLACGTVEPRKNLARLIAAWRQADTGLPLLVVGPDGWRSDELAADLATPGVVRLPYAARDALLGLIAGARALLFPTLAEGFGLPIVEAMALGTAVLTSTGGATAEVAGNAADLVDPYDVTAMARAIRQLARDDALVAGLVAAGRDRAAVHAPRQFLDRLERLYLRLIVSPAAFA